MHPALELQLKSFVSKKIGKNISTISAMRLRYFFWSKKIIKSNNFAKNNKETNKKLMVENQETKKQFQ